MPQNQLKTDSVKTSLNKGIAKQESKNIENSKVPTDKKVNHEKYVAELDFDKEIRAILDYRLNRVLREDLFCLICEVDIDEGQLA